MPALAHETIMGRPLEATADGLVVRQRYLDTADRETVLLDEGVPEDYQLDGKHDWSALIPEAS